MRFYESCVPVLLRNREEIRKVIQEELTAEKSIVLSDPEENNCRSMEANRLLRKGPAVQKGRCTLEECARTKIRRVGY